MCSAWPNNPFAAHASQPTVADLRFPSKNEQADAGAHLLRDGADANLAHLEGAVRKRQIPLPIGARFLNLTMPWRHLERYGEYRPDKIEEEQDLLWREGVEAGLYDPED